MRAAFHKESARKEQLRTLFVSFQYIDIMWGSQIDFYSSHGKLLVSPYLMGMFPLVGSWDTIQRKIIADDIVLQLELGTISRAPFVIMFNVVIFTELIFIAITSSWDSQSFIYDSDCHGVTDTFLVLLIIMFYRHRRIFQQANLSGVMTYSLLIRLSSFCGLRLIFTA